MDDIFKLLLANTRTPKSSYGDFKAMIGALYKGEKRIIDLVEEGRPRNLSKTCKDIKAVSERLMRKQISEWPNGVYEVDDCF